MVTDKIIRGEGVYLRQITAEDCTDQYVAWLNDPKVNETDINPPAELGRLADASGDKHSTRI